MDAVNYLKTYERMRDAEGIKTLERLFNEEATPEQRVELVEEWGRENPETSDEEKLCTLIAKLVVRVVDVEREINALKEVIE